MNIDTALRYAVPLVHGAEGFAHTAYLDRLPTKPVWTIGRGTTRINGAPVTAGMVCTLAQADAWAMADLTAAARFVLHCAKVPLTDGQLGALTSFCYNLGDGNFQRSSVLAALNAGDFSAAADQLLDYDHAGGIARAGLRTRRGRERTVFLQDGTATLAPAPVQPIAPETTTADDLNATVLASLRPQGTPT
jgi:lysozyme